MRTAALVLSLAVAANSSPLTDRASPRTVPTSVGWSSRSLNLDIPVERDVSVTSDKSKRQSWSLAQPGTTGVLAMMMAVVSPTQLLIVDRTAHNPLMVDGHNAWAAVYSLTSNTARPVRVQTNSFCAGGSWLANGTMVNIGGFRAEHSDIPDENGFQAVRHWYPEQCPDSGTEPCAFVEYPNRVRLAAARWYPSIVRSPHVILACQVINILTSGPHWRRLGPCHWWLQRRSVYELRWSECSKLRVPPSKEHGRLQCAYSRLSVPTDTFSSTPSSAGPSDSQSSSQELAECKPLPSRILPA